MQNVYYISDNIISSLGFDTDENHAGLLKGITGIKQYQDPKLAPLPFWASMVDNDRLNECFGKTDDVSAYSRFEKLIICSVRDALKRTVIDVSGNDTLLIISTTKGNIDLLQHAQLESERVYLWNTAQMMQDYFKLSNTPVVVSNACISGVLAVIIAARLISKGKYKNVIITGADIVSEFVLSGFNSFLSLCDGPCKPFDSERKGLSLGEAAGTIILSADKPAHGEDIILTGQGFSSNDANHISGPSRTGEGLYLAISKTLQANDKKVDYISAHGTATPYNDEMESIAITRSGLSKVPVNSLKGYWGHTLGAAGIIESVAAVQSLKHNVLYNTLGFDTLGVTQPVAVINSTRQMRVKTSMKIASGFGGCNAAVLFYKP